MHPESVGFSEGLPKRLSGVAQDSQVPPAGAGAGRRFHGRPAATLRGRRLLRRGLGRGFPDGIGERQEVVGVVLGYRVGKREAHHFPAPGDGQPFRVDGAEIVGVRLGVRGQGSEDGRGVAVDIGERGYRRPLAG